MTPYALGLRLGFEKSSAGLPPALQAFAKAPLSRGAAAAAEQAARLPRGAAAATAKAAPRSAPKATAPRKAPTKKGPVEKVPPVPQIPSQVGGIPTSLPELHGPAAPGLSRLAEAVGNPLYNALYHLDPAVQRAIYRTFGGQDVGRRLGALAGGVGLGSAIHFMGTPDYPDIAPGEGLLGQ